MAKSGMRFRYRDAATATRYKGSVHLHTTRSDGGMAPDAVRALYRGAGYDFIATTDHWVASNGTASSPGLDGGPLVIGGVELDGKDAYGSYYHIVCLGAFEGVDRSLGLETALSRCREQGAFTLLAHPAWTGNSVEEALRHRFDGVEIYNHVCRWLNGKGDGLFHWDALLERSLGVVGLAVDDAHLRPEHPGWNGGWIAVYSEALSADSLLRSLRNGEFYSSQGPSIEALEYDGGRLRVQTSPVRFARLVGPRWQGARIGSFAGEVFTECEFDVPADYAYMRLEVEDGEGRRAWTNGLFESA